MQKIIIISVYIPYRIFPKSLPQTLRNLCQWLSTWNIKSYSHSVPQSLRMNSKLIKQLSMFLCIPSLLPYHTISSNLMLILLKAFLIAHIQWRYFQFAICNAWYWSDCKDNILDFIVPWAIIFPKVLTYP